MEGQVKLRIVLIMKKGREGKGGERDDMVDIGEVERDQSNLTVHCANILMNGDVVFIGKDNHLQKTLLNMPSIISYK